MIMSAISSLGAWAWLALGAALLAAEIIIPGTFLLWIGLAAAATGVIFLLITAGWQIQVLVFACLALVSVIAWFRFARSSNEAESEQPNLNRRLESLVGRDFVLEEPISAGRGRVRIADSVWAVAGPDCASGARVRVASIEGTVLVVEPVQ